MLADASVASAMAVSRMQAEAQRGPPPNDGCNPPGGKLCAIRSFPSADNGVKQPTSSADFEQHSHADTHWSML